MQERIKERLEDYLGGRLPAGADSEFDNALHRNPGDKELVDQLSLHARMIRESFSVPAELAPAPGFYARVIARVEGEQSRSTFWSIFVEPFGRRLVYASAAFLLLLGAAMFSTQSGGSQAEVAEMPAQILVDHHPEVHLVGNTDEDRGRVLHTLTVLEQ